MKRIVLLSIILMMFNLNKLQSQTISKNESKTIVKSVKSEEGHEYELLVRLPPNYNNQNNYKVLYYLDGWWLSELVNGSYRLLDLTQNMEEVILVGISIEGDEAAWHIQRNRDYTPSTYDKEKMRFSMKGGTYELNEETTGGGEDFIEFLKGVVFHEIESIYNVDKENRGILGHSFGGLFAYYCLVQYPNLFNNYILISPAIWWNKSELLTDDIKSKIDAEANIYVVMGELENNMLKRPIEELKEELTKRENEENILEFREYNEMDHHSILPIGIYEGMQILYGLE